MRLRLGQRGLEVDARLQARERLFLKAFVRRQGSRQLSPRKESSARRRRRRGRRLAARRSTMAASRFPARTRHSGETSEILDALSFAVVTSLAPLLDWRSRWCVHWAAPAEIDTIQAGAWSCGHRSGWRPCFGTSWVRESQVDRLPSLYSLKRVHTHSPSGRCGRTLDVRMASSYETLAPFRARRRSYSRLGDFNPIPLSMLTDILTCVDRRRTSNPCRRARLVGLGCSLTRWTTWHWRDSGRRWGRLEAADFEGLAKLDAPEQSGL